VNWCGHLQSLEKSVQAIDVLQANISGLEKMKRLLEAEINRCGEESDFKVIKLWFSTNLETLNRDLLSFQKLIQICEEEVIYFGESSGKDVKGFLDTFIKFRDQYQAAVKFNAALKKKTTRRGKEEEIGSKRKSRGKACECRKNEYCPYQ